MWTIAGDDVTLNLDLTFDGQFVQPDPGSVKVTLRNTDGIAMSDWNDKLLPDPMGTSVNITIPGEYNTLAMTSEIEVRYVRLSYKVEGLSRGQSVGYRISPFIPIQASPEEVQSILGATEKEVPSQTIDILAAYYKLMEVHSDVLGRAIKSTKASANIAANKAVAIQAALEQTPALAAKLMQSESQDNATYIRMKVDLPALKRALEVQLLEELTLAGNALDGASQESLMTLMMLTTPADVITG
jgi:hypothetical protein